MNKLPRFAIALEYDGKQAPLVTARGHDEIANRILQLAHAADVVNAHGKKNKRLDPPGAFADSCGIKNALKRLIVMRQHFELIIGN